MPEQRTAKSPVWLKRLGGRIRQARRIRGFTQTDIARPNLTKSFISLLESGRTYPSVSTLVTLASRLQSSLALLLLETPQLPRETALNLLELARASAPANAAKTDRLLAAVEALSEDANDLRAELLLTRGDIAVVQGRPRTPNGHSLTRWPGAARTSCARLSHAHCRGWRIWHSPATRRTPGVSGWKTRWHNSAPRARCAPRKDARPSSRTASS